MHVNRLALAAFAFVTMPVIALGQKPAIAERDVKIEDDVQLRVVEAGEGDPIVFVHGLLGDHSVWQEQIEEFAARKFRAIAYSRRYNHPNTNDPQPDHSAAAEAEDLGLLLTKLGIEKAHVVGHSYGAYTALLFALKYPDRIKTLTLTEPPLVPWLKSIEDENEAAAVEHHERLYDRFIEPAKAAFADGKDDEALRIFFEYFAEKGAIDALPKGLAARSRRNLQELKAFTNSESRFPPIKPEAVQKLTVPVLMISGKKSKSTAQYTDVVLKKSLPRAHRLVFNRASHLMWVERPTKCRETVTRFIQEIGRELRNEEYEAATRGGRPRDPRK